MQIKCDGCGVIFEKSNKFINHAKKNNLKLFCGRECAQRSRITAVKCNCDQCGKSVTRTRAEYNSSKKHFCSTNCAAKYYNKTRDKDLYERIADKLRKPKEFSTCLQCGIKIPKNDRGRIRKFCSLKCSAKYRRIPMTIPQRLQQPARKIDKYIGYVRIYVPEHPEANTRGFCYEHRIIAEQKLGRRLIKK